MRALLRRLRTVVWHTRYVLNPRATTGLRLHLGCGEIYLPGYVNIDSNPRAECDLCLDLARVGAVFPEGSVIEVMMIHSLSYLRLWQARDLFVDLFRLLQPGGRFIIELPDLAKCAREALNSEADPGRYLEAVRGLFAFSLNQIRSKARYSPYAFGWSSWHLKSELEFAGFREVTILDPQTHGPRLWRDTRIEATR